MTNSTFTKEEIEQLMLNPYVISASPNKITYSLEFKKFVIRETGLGLKSTEVFKKAGFDIDMLGKPRIYAAVKEFKRQATSPEGLRGVSIKMKEERMAKFAKEDLSKKQTKVAIRELQDKIVRLEQQIEFLKKIQSPEK